MNKKRLIYFILTCCMFVIIFLFSHQTSEESNYLSSSITNGIFEIFFKNSVVVNAEEVDETQIDENYIIQNDSESKTNEDEIDNTKNEQNDSKKSEFPTSNKLFQKMNAIMRKSAHVFLYAALAFVLMLFLSTYDLKKIKLILLTILICFIYACLDEFHQLLGGTRGAAFSDSLLDTFGCCIGCFFNCLLIRRKKVIFKHKKYNLKNKAEL